MTAQFSKGSKDNVRFAQEDDEDALYRFVCDGHDESAIFRLDEKKVRDVIAASIKRDVRRPVIIGVIDKPDKTGIAASVAVEYTQAWYSEDWFLCELWNNVHADFRHSHYARDLLAFGKWLAENTKRPLSMSIITTTRMEAKIALYKRKMPQIGACFMYNLFRCSGPAITEMSHGW